MTQTINRKPKLADHPCFNKEASHTSARVHLPVASRCNVQCNFCDRDFACVNESRPGVTVAMLKPRQALGYLAEMRQRLPTLSVVGIAGPGDPFANPEETLETLALVRAAHPDLLLCVATNGLNLMPYVDDLAKLDVSHVTITVNAVRPEIGEKIYSWMRYGKGTRHGAEAAEYLWHHQQMGILALKARDIIVKVNTILIPGINDQHIAEIAQTVAAAGADVLNVIPMHPTAGTLFGGIAEPPAKELTRIRAQAAAFLPQMGHCTRCRADAAGILGQPQTIDQIRLLQAASGADREPAVKPKYVLKATTPARATEPAQAKDRPYVAVSTMEGMLINQHLGEAERLYIYQATETKPALVAIRETPPAGGGENRWQKLATLLADCSTLLVNGVGPSPRSILGDSGLQVMEVEGLIDTALNALGQGKDVEFMLKRAAFKCGSACEGTGNGCN